MTFAQLYRVYLQIRFGNEEPVLIAVNFKDFDWLAKTASEANLYNWDFVYYKILRQGWVLFFGAMIVPSKDCTQQPGQLRVWTAKYSRVWLLRLQEVWIEENNS